MAVNQHLICVPLSTMTEYRSDLPRRLEGRRSRLKPEEIHAQGPGNPGRWSNYGFDCDGKPILSASVDVLLILSYPAHIS